MRNFGWLSLISCALKVAAEKVVVGYYVPQSRVAPKALPYDKVTHINYGFGLLNRREDPTFIYFNRYYDGNKMRDIKKHAAANKVKVLMSVRGCLGSQTFLLMARKAESRAKFINNLLVFVRKNTKPEEDKYPDGWDLDGIDLDWEYPGCAAAKYNVLASNDSANYLILLKELRDALKKEFPNDHKLLTAAVRVKLFDDTDGEPMPEVSEYAKYFDFVNIMAYDIMGSWSNTTGPNAPFKADIAKGGDPYSFTQAIDDWLAAGFPASKLTAGLAFYGRTFITKTDMDETQENMYQPKESEIPKGDSSDSNKPNKFCNEGASYSGVYKYKYLRQDALSSPNTSINGYIRHYDNFTQTPWLFHPQTKKFISYDDPQSLKVKIDYVIKKNLLGVMCWDMTMDYNDELLNEAIQIRNGARLSVPTSTNVVPTDKSTGICQSNEGRCVNEAASPKYAKAYSANS